jgi:hypothetical protein
MGGLFSSETDIDVFVQRLQLLQEQLIDPVSLALAAETEAGFDFGTVLTEDTLPNSLLIIARRMTRRLEQNNPDYHPFGLPKLSSPIPGIGTRDTLPVFWLRNQNIDLNSCWWNIFTENDVSYTTSPTDFNDDYWVRDLDDPDIDRIPDENFTLLSERFPEATREFRGGDSYPFVPYELVYPEWFKAHPEYVKTTAIIEEFGLDVDDLIYAIRDNEDQDQVDHSIFGFFNSLQPKTEQEGFYLYEYFREVFKDVAFNQPLSKKQSRCVTFALDKNGFYDKEGKNVGWINPEGANLSQLKNNNYYYEKRFLTETSINFTNTLEPILEFTDPREELKLELLVEDVIIRKVRGNIKDLRHNDVRVLVVRGSTEFPEFNNFGQAVYPTNPTVSTYPFSAAQLEAYDDNVLDLHEFSYEGSFFGDPDAAVVIQCQKKFSSHFSKHPWDTETATTLNRDSDDDYYEEIIILNPRSKFKGIYSENHKSPPPFKALSPPEEEDFFIASDDDKVWKFDRSSGRYVLKNFSGTGLIGEPQDAAGLVIPLLEKPLNSLLLKRREEVVGKSLSLLTMSIIKTKTSTFDKLFEAFVFGVSLYFAFTGTAGFLSTLANQGYKEAFKQLVRSYIKAKIIEEIAEEVIEFAAEEFGIEFAGQLATVATLYSTYTAITTPTNLLPDDELFLLTSQLNNEFIEYTTNEIETNIEQAQEFQEAGYEKIEEIKKLEENAIGYADPENSRRILRYAFVEETPTEFFRRTTEIPNPGIDVFDLISTSISRWKRLSHEETPIIVAEDVNTLEELNVLE